MSAPRVSLQYSRNVLFITRCAWCGVELSRKYVSRPECNERGVLISDGICGRCQEWLLEDTRDYGRLEGKKR
jgi:hypothetical protein